LERGEQLKSYGLKNWQQKKTPQRLQKWAKQAKISLQQAREGPARGARLAAQRRALAMAQQERERTERAAH
jgi:hypothetical protein